MHDTDRILAELAALDQAEQEADFELAPESEYEDLENLADFEFEPEANFEAFQSGEAFEDEQPAYEASPPLTGGAPYERAEYESEDEGAYSTYQSEAQFEDESQFEAEDQFEDEDRYEAESESTFSEVHQMELAAELLEVQNEAELDHFLGGLLKTAVEGIGKALKSPIGGHLVGLLKTAAKTALPVAGTALGTFLGGPVGAALGGDIASTAGKLLGLELEGLAREDQEFEAAKAFVRLAADAAQDAATAPPTLDPLTIARTAFANAASRHAPGLLATASPGPAIGPPYHRHHHHHNRRMTGRWVRVARNQIVLYGI